MSFTSRRGVWLVASARAISWLGDEVAAIALTLRLQPHGAGVVAALLIANMLPMLVLSGVVGRMIDRVDNRALLVSTGLAQAAICVILAETSGTTAVLGLVCLLGVGQAVNSATWQALLPAVAGPDRLPAAIALTQMCTTTAGIVAPALSGVLTGAYGARVPLLVDAATFVVIASAAVFLRVERPARQDGEPMRGGFAIVRHDDLLRPLFVLLALFVLLGSVVNVVEVFLVRATLHASATWYGFVGATFAVGMLAGAASGGRLSGFARLARSFVVSCLVLALGLVAMGLTPSVVVALPVAAMIGVGNGLLNVALGGLVMGRAVPAERGRVAAMLSGTASGVQLAAFAAGGALCGAIGPRAVFLLGGCLGLLAPILLGRRLVRAADWAACQTPTSPQSGGDSPQPAESPTPSLAT